MTIIDNFISITDIRKKASFYINNIKSGWDKIIFVNNKPKAVLIDIEKYDKLLNNNIEFSWLIWSQEFIWTEEHSNLLTLMRKA